MAIVGRERPGEKQQREASKRAEVARRVAHEDRPRLKAARQLEDEQKKQLMEREKGNYTRILALKCHNGWLKLCDNSAMIVGKKLDGRLGKTYKVAADNGYGTRAEYGVISIPPVQVEDFIGRLDRAGIKLVVDGAWSLEFDLGERVSQEEMVRMLQEDSLLIERANKLVMPKVVLPELRADVKALLEFVHVQVRNQKDTTRQVLMNDVERRAIEANKLIIATARGYVGIKECLDEIGFFTEEMYEDATTMCDMKVITAKKYRECVNLIMRIESDRARELKRMVIAKTEAEMNKPKKRSKHESTIVGERRPRVVQRTLGDLEQFGGGDKATAEEKEEEPGGASRQELAVQAAEQ